MTTFLMILSTLAAILLIVVVLLQNSKGGGLDSSFGNVNQLGGVAQSTETIEKATWTLAGIIAILSLVAAVKYSPNQETTTVISTEGYNVEAPSNNDPLNLPTDLPE
ncbi:MAG: preprotein translocase subunit SecG [Bacteroidota bacterium]|nr:preprotein translocase subunit SecG [Bacteroidota bacterium]